MKMTEIQTKPDIIPGNYRLASTLRDCEISRNIKILDEYHKLKAQGDYYLLKVAFREKKINEKEFQLRLMDRIKRKLVWVDII